MKMGPPRPKTLREREEEVKEEYMKTLVDLQINDKCLIDVLTEVAAENKEYAACIVECIEEQLEKVSGGPLKLPILYLIDSIIKCESIKQYYLPLFCRKIHILFMKVYELADDNIKSKLAKLRFTWIGVLPVETLTALDNAVRSINRRWRPAAAIITAAAATQPELHGNPKFISADVPAVNATKTNPTATKESLRLKKKELLQLTQRKQELEEELKVLRPAQQAKSKLPDIVNQYHYPLTGTEEQSGKGLASPLPYIPHNHVPSLASKTWNKSSPNNQYVLNRANGSLPAQQQQNGPAFRIAPVNCALILAAARRARDPRLQKVANAPTAPKKLPPPPTSEAAAIVNGRRDAIVPKLGTAAEPKITKRNESPKKSVVVAEATTTTTTSKKTKPPAKSKSVATKNSLSSSTTIATAPSTVQETEPTNAKRRKIEKVAKTESPQPASNGPKNEETRKRKALSERSNEKSESNTPSPSKRKSNGESAAKNESVAAQKKSTGCGVSGIINELFEGAPKMEEKRLSKEERAKRLRILVEKPKRETERLLENMRKKSPKMAEKFIRLMKKEKETLKTSPVVDVDADADSSPSRKRKSPPPKTEPKELDVADVDCFIVSSPKPAPEKKMCPPPRPESLDDEYDPIIDLPEPGESHHSPKAEPKVEPAVCTPPPTQDVDLRALMAPATVIIPPPMSVPVIVSPHTRQSPPTAPVPGPLSIFPFMVPGIDFPFPGMVQAPSVVEVPAANADMLESIDRDPMSKINIDGVPREIRHYGSTAVVFLNWDDPRQISFSTHEMRRIVVDGKYFIDCRLNTPDIERSIYGLIHKFRLGAPTREVFIDGKGYECYFNGPPIDVWLDGKYHKIRLQGKTPKVDIGHHKRTDLVAGKINIIVNDMHTFPAFLDAKSQKIEVEGNKFVILFIDALQRIVINGVPFRTDFGGINHPFKYYDKIIHFRLSMLPMGILPGAITIHQMITSKLPEPPPLPPSLRYTAGDEFPLLPVPPLMSNVPIPVPMLSPISTVPNPYSAATYEPSTSQPAVRENETAPKESLSIDELVQKLLAEGLMPLPEVTSTSTVKGPSPPKTTTTGRSKKSKKENQTPKDEPIKHVDLSKSETLKQKQPGMLALLFNGNQCSSCGLRFPEDQTFKYSEHLDWHFRLNRRGKNGARTIHSRKWYYKPETWLQFQEIEDESDRGQSWFDNHPSTEYTEEVIEEVPCVRASADVSETCELCCDRFEQFYNQELDEWQLRNAINVDGKIYHPICFKDHKPEDDDVQEIVDETEPISLTEDEPEPSSTTDNVISVDDFELPDVSFIKQEKVDNPKAAEKCENEGTRKEEESTQEPVGKPADEDYDSDIEEVQLIEEPIEEIIIPDDEPDDLECANLETLHIEDIISLPVDMENSVVETPVENPMDKIVDITHSVSTVLIDGNVEPGDSLPQVARGPTIIKLNMGKSSPKHAAQVSPKSDESEKSDKIHEFGGMTCVNEEPPPPGEEPMLTLVPADLKPRIKERKLTTYPPVKKRGGDSALCAIM